MSLSESELKNKKYLWLILCILSCLKKKGRSFLKTKPITRYTVKKNKKQNAGLSILVVVLASFFLFTACNRKDANESVASENATQYSDSAENLGGDNASGYNAATGTPNSGTTTGTVGTMTDTAGTGTQTDQVQGATSGDERITQNIRQQIGNQYNSTTTAQSVSVTTTNGAVVLRGSVQSQAEKTRIESIARQAAGNNRVTNEITVRQ